MSDTKNTFMEDATLNYMINPIYDSYNRNNTNKNSKSNVNNEEKKFYKKRILSITKDLFKSNSHPEYIKNLHLGYVEHIIQYIKLIDTKDIIQEEYESLNKNDSIPQCSDINLDMIDKANECVYNIKPKPVTLDNFIKRKSTNKEKNIKPPRKKNINLKNPTLKTKGIKSKDMKPKDMKPKDMKPKDMKPKDMKAKDMKAV